MASVKNSPYSGTIYVNDSYKGGVTKSLCKELFEVENRHKSQISIIVKASSGAQILLYDETKDEKWALKITLGSDNGLTSTIGLNSTSSEQEAAYPTKVFQTPRILNANHFKAFVIQWNYGLIQVVDDGGDPSKPLLTWTGPSDLRIGHFGIRTFGASGTWRVQGSPEISTAETNDIGSPYQHFALNSGRLEFEIRSNGDSYVILSKQPNDDDQVGLIHLIIGAWANNRNAIFQSIAEVANYGQVATLNDYEYRRFWAEWNAYSIRFGVYGADLPKMFFNSVAPISQLSYFGFITAGGHKSYFRVSEDDATQPTIGAY